MELRWRRWRYRASAPLTIAAAAFLILEPGLFLVVLSLALSGLAAAAIVLLAHSLLRDALKPVRADDDVRIP